MRTFSSKSRPFSIDCVAHADSITPAEVSPSRADIYRSMRALYPLCEGLHASHTDRFHSPAPRVDFFWSLVLRMWTILSSIGPFSPRATFLYSLSSAHEQYSCTRADICPPRAGLFRADLISMICEPLPLAREPFSFTRKPSELILVTRERNFFYW